MLSVQHTAAAGDESTALVAAVIILLQVNSSQRGSTKPGRFTYRD
jgi:hypothetical protein